jgi:hypothetical protein
MPYHLWQNIPIMARALVWLEDSTFAAWGCNECGWITPSGRQSGETPPAVKEAFNKHECAKFPRFTPISSEVSKR